MITINDNNNYMVTVLMSTYNGEKFIREQIDSILNQKEVEVSLLVRDDGSTDSTLDILEEYQSDGLLKYYKSENLGAAKSFMQLLYDAPASDYYAFSDQDDYWEKDKLYVAINKIKNKNEIPAMYFSRTNLTDSKLNPTGSIAINPLLTFGESLVYEFVAGCTIVMNQSLRDIAIKYHPKYLAMHDTWIYSMALAIGGNIVFDKNSYILYRQHGNNTIGQGQGCLHEWKRRLSRLLNNEQSRYKRACELKEGFFGMMPDNNRHLLSAFIEGKRSFPKRLELAFSNQLRCANKSTSVMFKIALLLNTY